MDAEASKQLLLTRIALERVQLSHDVAVLETAARPGHMISNGLRALLPTGLTQALFSPANAAARADAARGMGNGLVKVVLLARRYPILMSIAGGLLARRTIRRVLFVGVLGVVGAGFWLAKSNRRRI